MGNIAIVSCTSSDLTPQQAEQAGVRLVPLTVTFGDETFEAVTELTNEEFYRRLTAPGAPFPRTAAPNPAQFQAAFQDALDADATGVVCITISSEMSATYSAAVAAAGEFEPGWVSVIDSRTVTQAQGLIVKRAADLAATGAEQAEVVDLVADLVGRVRLLFTPETLEYLQKGGRIGRASALVGSVLSIKPILGVEDGAVVTVDKKRTAAKARARLLELIGSVRHRRGGGAAHGRAGPGRLLPTGSRCRGHARRGAGGRRRRARGRSPRRPRDGRRLAHPDCLNSAEWPFG